MEVKRLASKIKFKTNLIFILFFVIFLLLINFYYLKSNFETIVFQNDFVYSKGDLKYRILLNDDSNCVGICADNGADNSNYLLIIGDIMGINSKSAIYVNSFDSKTLRTYNHSSLIIVNVGDFNISDLNENNFLDRISNDNAVIVADNFCVDDWFGVMESKKIYDNTFLSPGKFCFSEEESQMISYLIRYFGVSEIDYYYDSDSYLNLTSNFLVYLDENDIEYNLLSLDVGSEIFILGEEE